MIKKLSNMDYNQKRKRCGQYIDALEEERHKIEVFQREFPLCLDLVTRAIETCKREIPEMRTNITYGQLECSEQTTECGLVLEQFLTIKDSSISNVEEDEDEHENHNPYNDIEDKSTKSDWLKSVQLWNQPDPLLPKEERLQNELLENTKKNESMSKDSMMISGEEEIRKREDEKDRRGGRKPRRCWSSQLHRRFLNALQHLGGPHATPKQIRELMKVDGLTNDEVKSHLQKYRLHTRRPCQTASNNENSQTQHFVVVDGLWVPRSDNSTCKTTGGGTISGTTRSTTTTDIYGAMTAPQLPKWSSHSNFSPSIILEEGSGSHSEKVVVRCRSPTISSSTHNHYVKNS